MDDATRTEASIAVLSVVLKKKESDNASWGYEIDTFLNQDELEHLLLELASKVKQGSYLSTDKVFSAV